MFRAASLMLINKIDLLPHVDFDLARVMANAREVNPEMPALRLSPALERVWNSGPTGCAVN